MEWAFPPIPHIFANEISICFKLMCYNRILHTLYNAIESPLYKLLKYLKTITNQTSEHDSFMDHSSISHLGFDYLIMSPHRSATHMNKLKHINNLLLKPPCWFNFYQIGWFNLWVLMIKNMRFNKNIQINLASNDKPDRLIQVIHIQVTKRYGKKNLQIYIKPVA